KLYAFKSTRHNLKAGDFRLCGQRTLCPRESPETVPQQKLPRCISISLLDYDFFPGREEYHAVYRLRDSEGRDLTDLWELHIIELTKALKGTPVDDWIRLFNAENEEELDMITTKNEGITEAINVLKSMSLRRPLKAFQT
ncbi:MAG: PD-(D/E)XK nuclease family transposase, partial [Lachnospiraceae bacterium]